ncbi:hypothetical protein TrLO_g5728 [Triparma laevis f. longispina]|uniref:Uncharacterized protein n=1 Tax=Triparma laevis f. longispina TaxID=1714387 RepID=A0A9W7AJX1_9STRA|nr:hypothetical protein TrLO_g5728 [Triparma laevis f. longispina]
MEDIIRFKLEEHGVDSESIAQAQGEEGDITAVKGENDEDNDDDYVNEDDDEDVEAPLRLRGGISIGG